MEPTVRDIVVWADEFEVSVEQIQKAYDWQITQWSVLGNTILTALFGLLSSALIETFKDAIKFPNLWREVGVCALFFGCSYIVCRLRITWLRQEFLALYTILLEIK